MSSTRHYSTCKGCGQSECNDLLLGRDHKCGRCGRKVKLYEPRRNKEVSGGSDSVSKAAGSESPDVLPLLKKSLAAAQDPSLRATLEAQIHNIQQQKQSEGDVVGSLKRADGAWRDANNRHTQAVQTVVRLEKSLAAAKEKEVRLAREVAQADLLRKQAAEILAAKEGLSAPKANSQEAAASKPFAVVFDEELFKNVDELECDPAQRDSLKQMHTELLNMQTNLDAKAQEVTKLIDSATQLRKQLQDKKKRKADDGDEAAAVPPAVSPQSPAPTAAPGASTGASAAASAIPSGQSAASTAHDQKVAAEAAIISQAKFLAEQEASAQKPFPSSGS